MNMELVERIGFEELVDEAQFPVVYVVVNRLEEGDRVLRVFADSQDALDYAFFEADINELDEYVIIEQELIPAGVIEW
jgi:hypothetical protein